MHAIERLRWVAGSRRIPAAELAEEAAWALAELAEVDPVALVPACRRLLERHPGCGPLWWLSACVLSAADGAEAAVTCAMALADDPTDEHVEDTVAESGRIVRRGSLADVAGADAVLVVGHAVGGAELSAAAALVEPEHHRLAAAAADLGIPIWLRAGVGCQLPPRLWEAALASVGVDAEAGLDDRAGPIRSGGTSLELVGLGSVATVIGPAGPEPVAAVVGRRTCSEPAELLRGWSARR